MTDNPVPTNLARFPRMVAIDPGTLCGFAWIDVKSPVPEGLKALPAQSGLWKLSKDRFQSQGMRFLHLKKSLIDIAPDFVVFEQVNFPHKSTAAAQMYWGCVSTIQVFCEEYGIEYVGVLTGDLKRRATGKGNSGKELIIEAANSFWEVNPPLLASKLGDDGIADALWLLQIGIETYGNVITFRDANRKPKDLNKTEEPANGRKTARARRKASAGTVASGERTAGQAEQDSVDAKPQTDGG